MTADLPLEGETGGNPEGVGSVVPTHTRSALPGISPSREGDSTAARPSYYKGRSIRI
jgi:hypothetical protein